MSRLQTSFVLGYHGCEKATGLSVVGGGNGHLRPSRNGTDWVGSGIYFWESDPLRALEWAEERKALGKIKEPFVIGAVIDLGNCLDLLNRSDLEILRSAHDLFKQDRDAAEMPANRQAPRDKSPDKVLRGLDCAVIDFLHEITEKENPPPGFTPLDSVRGLFVEGGPLYEGGAFMQKTHIQIAVRDAAKCIRGYFLPLPPL